MRRNKLVQVLSLTTIIAIGHLSEPGEALASEGTCNGVEVTMNGNGPCGCSTPHPTECSAGIGGCCGVRVDNGECYCYDPQ